LKTDPAREEFASKPGPYSLPRPRRAPRRCMPLTWTRISSGCCAPKVRSLSHCTCSNPQLGKPVARYPVKGSDVVDKRFPKYVAPGEPEPGTGKPLKEDRVHINKEQHFEGVPPEVWNFDIGGYQVREKWLKDRRGRTHDL
jgi:hypothetical protein